MARRKLKVDEFDLTLEGHRPLQLKTISQRAYHTAMSHNPMTIGLGPAGAGKTYVASAWAAEQLSSGQVERVVLTRPLVTVDNEQVGFLPGDLNKKMEPWTAPIVDVFKQRVGVERTHEFIKTGAITIVPFAFMQGRTFSDSVVLVDEAQNMSVQQAKTLVTRIGERCTYIISGDLEQSYRHGESGLARLVEMVQTYNLPVPIIRFDESEIVRSPLCKAWVSAFRREGL